MTNMFEDMAADSYNAGLEPVDSIEVTYNPHNGTPSTFQAIWNEQDVGEQYYPDSKQAVAAGTLNCKIADVPTPDTRDTFTIKTVTWTVETILSKHPNTLLELQTRDELYIGGLRSRKLR